MTDRLDDLKAAFDAATPAPDARRKRETISVAEKTFADLQGSAGGTRPTPQNGLIGRALKGVKPMINIVTTRAGLTATTALVAVGMIAVLPNLTPPDTLRDIALQPEFAAEQGVRSRSELEQAPLLMEDAFAREGDATQSVQAEPSVRRALEQSDTTMALPAPMNRALGQALDPALVLPEEDSEAFANAPDNPVQSVAEAPVSTFSIDVDTASYAIVRSSLMAGQLPPRDAVRVEEMVNYFPYAYPAPSGPHPFRPTINVLPTPWNESTNLVHIGIQGTLPAIEDRPPLNLVFLIDTSGSMQAANKLPLLKQSFRLMLADLRPQDQVAIVTYAGSAGQVLEPTSADDRATIEAALDRLDAGGATAGQAGLQQAYHVAERMADDNEVTRVILATDGDFNVGLSDPDALETYIADQRESGTYLSVLGFGRGNLDDAVMQSLAQNGNGTAAYIDTLSEAQKVLVDQVTGALFPIANDVKIQVEFNPAEIAEYRLIGYETRALAREDFNNDGVDAGDIGAGHRVTALYEVTPVGSDAILNDPLRYSDNDVATDSAHAGEIGYVKLRYKQPGDTESTLMEQPIRSGTDAISEDVQFSVAIAGFGQLLRRDTHLGNWSWTDAIDLATSTRGEDRFGYRAEALQLMRLAESLSR